MKICKVIENKEMVSENCTYHVKLTKGKMYKYDDSSWQNLHVVKMESLELWLFKDEFNRYFEEVKNIFEEKEVEK